MAEVSNIVEKDLTDKIVFDVPKDWGKLLSGRRIDFGKPGEGEGLAWGIEVSIPVNVQIRSDMERAGYILPETIDTIKFLDMRPQESLPKKLRTINSGSLANPFSLLQKIASTTNANPDIDSNLISHLINPSLPSRTLTRLMDSVFAFNKSEVKKFNDELRKSKGSTLVIIEGHAGGDPHKIGEYDWQEVVDDSGKVLQRARNEVLTDEIIEARYNDPSEVAAVVVRGCNLEKANLEQKNVAVIYPLGGVKETGFLSGLQGTKTVVLSPKGS